MAPAQAREPAPSTGPEPFKNLIGPHTVRDLGSHLQRVWPAFDQRRFAALALKGLEALEFKARAHHLGATLVDTLPDDFARTATLIEASLRPVNGDEALSELRTSGQGLAGWVVWPLGEAVVRLGMGHPQRALSVLHALTQRFTAEYAIRPFIVQHPALVFDTLAQWATDPSPHVRRLVSEGSRPRLPWGLQLKALVADPSPTLALLRILQDDTSEYVRRSVANHLNDIAKDHPAVVANWLEDHLPGAPPERAALLRHASRTLIKTGDPRVLKAWGLGQRLRGQASFALTPSKLRLGASLELVVTLVSTARRPQKLVIDYAVHHVKANGSTSPKVFKGWTLELQAGETRTLSKRHAVRPITTRQYHAGWHPVDLLINGEALAQGGFDLRL